MAEEPKKPATPPPASPPAPAVAPAADATQAADAKDKKGGKEKKEKGPGFFAARTPRELSFIKVVGFFLVLVLLDFIVIQPTSNYLKGINEDITLEEKMIPNRLKILGYKDRVLSEYRELKPYRTDPALGQEEEIARLLREIERVSKEASLFVSNINPVKVDKKSDIYYELSLDIEGKGGINQIRQFMHSLEALNPSIRINGFNLKPQSKDSDDLKYSFSIIKLGVKDRSLDSVKA